MKTLIVLGFIFVLSFSIFTEDLVNKYSIEVQTEGTPNTEPKKGDSVEMHY